MKYSTLVIAVATFSFAFLNQIKGTLVQESQSSFTSESLASQFILQSNAFDLFHTANPGITGDVTDKISYPVWAAINRDIKIYVEGGVGYVFMPATSNLYSTLNEKTRGTSFLGYSDETNIITNAGRLAKPQFIPKGNVVYVR